MNILFISSEAAPLVKVGGLADVTGSLPRALNALGHDVRVLIPQYLSIDTSRFPLSPVKSVHFPYLGAVESVTLNKGTPCKGTPCKASPFIYTLENQKYFGTREVYANDLERFFFFSRAAFEILPYLGWQPDIVHCHDWLTALTVMWLKKSNYPCSTMFTIHNLAYQGFFDEDFLRGHGLEKEWDGPLNFMAQAILRADLVSTVSETYAREITTPEYGVGMDSLLIQRAKTGKLIGIVNGIDYEDWNPAMDEYLPVNFDSANLAKRALNKVALQRVTGLPVNNDIPLIGMVQRLDEQKGIDILGQGVDAILHDTGAQFVILGRGRNNYETMLRQIASRYPQQVAAFIAFEEPLAHLIYAGCDMFLMPSRFEPCGLGQMIAMRYGALPIVRHTGGLVDTVPEFTPDLGQGNGFVFHEYTPEALLGIVKEACAAFRKKNAWSQAIRRVSQLDFSWQSSARKYESAYLSLTRRPLGESGS